MSTRWRRRPKEPGDERIDTGPARAFADVDPAESSEQFCGQVVVTLRVTAIHHAERDDYITS